MKCRCTLNNRYEVIGPCDLEEFNQKISEFEDESWNQVNISKIFTIDSNKPSVKKILKTYLDIKVTSSEIIETPKANAQSIEGFNSTGKMLLVFLEIHEKILYADDCSQNINSIEFKNNFSSYINLDENVNPKKDKYCVYPFIENISLNILNPKNINRTIQLFLFAHKIELNTQINIPNEFVFYDSSNLPQKEMARITFDSTNKVLKATPTTTLYRDLDVSFSLTNNNGSIVKAKGTLKRNIDSNDFASKLNNQSFKIGDLIRLDYTTYRNTSKLINYPNMGDIYDMNFVSDHIFKITKDGVIPYILPNVISLKTPRIFHTPIFSIGFDILSKTLLSRISAIEPIDPIYTGQEYFRFVVKNSNLEEKYHVSVKGGEFANNPIDSLLGKAFEYGDILELIYKEGDKIEITNTPYPSNDKYTLTGTNQSFRITKNGLVKI